MLAFVVPRIIAVLPEEQHDVHGQLFTVQRQGPPDAVVDGNPVCLGQCDADVSLVDLVDVERFDEVLAEVREQEKFLDALRMAQPLLNAAVMNSIMNVNQLTREIDAVVDKVELKIDKEYEDVARYRKILTDEKADILKAFEIIYAAYRTDEPDLSALKESRIIWMPELVP